MPDLAVLLLQMDVASEDSVSRAIASTVSSFGRIDIAVNNAGISGVFSPTQAAPWEDWERVYNINFHGVWRCQKYELQQMVRQEAQEMK